MQVVRANKDSQVFREAPGQRAWPEHLVRDSKGLQGRRARREVPAARAPLDLWVLKA